MTVEVESYRRGWDGNQTNPGYGAEVELGEIVVDLPEYCTVETCDPEDLTVPIGFVRDHRDELEEAAITMFERGE